MKRAERIAALSALASARRDADLARLAAVAARLSGALNARDELAAALAHETNRVQEAPDLPALKALDAHVLLAERARGALEAGIVRLTAEKEQQRRLCARSFGRADVLDHLHAQLKAARRRIG